MKKKSSRKRGAANRSCAEPSGSLPSASEDRILQLSNDLSEGYKTGTIQEWREVARYWMAKQLDETMRANHLADRALTAAMEGWRWLREQRGVVPNDDGWIGDAGRKLDDALRSRAANTEADRRGVEPRSGRASG